MRDKSRKRKRRGKRVKLNMNSLENGFMYKGKVINNHVDSLGNNLFKLGTEMVMKKIYS